MTQANTNTAANITAFLTVAGIDLVLRRDGVQHRARATYDRLETFLDGVLTQIELTDDDDVLSVKFGDLELDLALQPKGHYFSWLQSIEKADACDISEARRLMRVALKAKAKAGKPAAVPAAPL